MDFIIIEVLSLIFRYRVYYSQTKPLRQHQLEMINWWNHGKGLFHHPTLPFTKSLYSDFKEEELQVPVLHVRFQRWCYINLEVSHFNSKSLIRPIHGFFNLNESA